MTGNEHFFADFLFLTGNLPRILKRFGMVPLRPATKMVKFDDVFSAPAKLNKSFAQFALYFRYCFKQYKGRRDRRPPQCCIAQLHVSCFPSVLVSFWQVVKFCLPLFKEEKGLRFTSCKVREIKKMILLYWSILSRKLKLLKLSRL